MAIFGEQFFGIMNPCKHYALSFTDIMISLKASHIPKSK